MGYVHADAVFFLGLPPTETHVLGVLASRANNKTLACWEPQDRLAFLIGRDERTVRRAVRELRRRKMIVLLEPSQRHRSPLYVLNLDAWTTPLKQHDYIANWSEEARTGRTGTMLREVIDERRKA